MDKSFKVKVPYTEEKISEFLTNFDLQRANNDEKDQEKFDNF